MTHLWIENSLILFDFNFFSHLQQVRELDNSPWSKTAEDKGLWGYEAIRSTARTRAVREMATFENRPLHLSWDEDDIQAEYSDEDDVPFDEETMEIIPEVRSSRSQNILFGSPLGASPDIRRQPVSLDLAVKSTPRFSALARQPQDMRGESPDLSAPNFAALSQSFDSPSELRHETGLPIQSTPRFASLSTTSPFLSSSLQALPQASPDLFRRPSPSPSPALLPRQAPPRSASPHLLPHKRRMFIPGPTPPPPQRNSRLQTTARTPSPQLRIKLNPAAEQSVATPLSPSLWGPGTLARFQSMPSVADSPTPITRSRHGESFRASNTSLTMHRTGMGKATMSSNTSGVQPTGERCMCPPDPVLPHDFMHSRIS